jgi:hypothetical protein
VTDASAEPQLTLSRFLLFGFPPLILATVDLFLRHGDHGAEQVIHFLKWRRTGNGRGLLSFAATLDRGELLFGNWGNDVLERDKRGDEKICETDISNTTFASPCVILKSCLLRFRTSTSGPPHFKFENRFSTEFPGPRIKVRNCC